MNTRNRTSGDLEFDLAVVGAGILGLAHAWQAAKRGLKVVVFEKGAKAMGASIRNFGMVWPIGQPPGTMREWALNSRECWLEMARKIGLWHRCAGSLHLAYLPEEKAVLEEFAEKGPAYGYECSLLTVAQAMEKCPSVKPEGLHCALWSPTEINVDPVEALVRIPDWLSQEAGVNLQFNTTVTGVHLPDVETSRGIWKAQKVIVCSGSDLQLLYPDFFAASGLIPCKLQMMSTVPQPPGYDLGPMLAGGLTLRHYKNFEICFSLGVLKEKLLELYPEHEQYGIHVMVSQNRKGELILGDSHEYGDAVTIFDSGRIEELILDYLGRFFCAPEGRIGRRWHGIYVKHPSLPCVMKEVEPGVHIRTGPGGAGMTLAFGLAKQTIETLV